MRIFIAAILGSVLSAGAGSPAGPADSTGPTLELLSQYVIPPGLRFQGACIGGLSAIDYDAAEDLYYVLSDDRSGARFFTLDIDLGTDDGGKPVISKVTFRSVVELRRRGGQPFPDGGVDPEGFVLTGPGRAYISSEGVARRGVAPFVDLFDLQSGESILPAPVPDAYVPSGEGAAARGVRDNLGFESLALSADGRELYVATESSLAQDGDDFTAGSTVFSRILHYRLGEGGPRVKGELLYPLTWPEGDVVVHGLVELQALGDRHLLAMERTYRRDAGMDVKLYEIRWDGTVDVERGTPIVAKKPGLDLGGILPMVDNFEGLAFGPDLPGGDRSLLAVGDNNNTECATSLSLSSLVPTRLLLFRLTG